MTGHDNLNCFNFFTCYPNAVLIRLGRFENSSVALNSTDCEFKITCKVRLKVSLYTKLQKVYYSAIK